MDYVFKNSDEKIKIITELENYNGMLCGEYLDKNCELYKKIMKELSYDFNKTCIRLNKCSRNLSNNLEGTDLLFISKNIGGFNRKGIVIKENDEKLIYKNLNFVDLVLDEENIEKGEMNIFTHELGHVMMTNIMPEFIKYSKSTKQHCSMGITDYYNAFFEGFGEHFERLTFDYINKYRDCFNKRYKYKFDPIKLWHCDIDANFRINKVLENGYIYKKILPSVSVDTMNLSDIIMLEHTSCIYDKTKVLNGNEMLSSEGVMATLFYRINTNDKIKNNYMKREDFNKFALNEIPNSEDIKNIFSPFENVMLKNFLIWNLMKDKINEESIPAIDYITLWCEYFEDDKEEILKIFISTTLGTTFTNDLKEIYEELSLVGMVGNVDKFITKLEEYKELYSHIVKLVKDDKLSLSKNVYKEIWVKSDNIVVPSVLWDDKSKKPLMININTASIYDLLAINNIDFEKAEKIIKVRDNRKGFGSLDEFYQILYNDCLF